jgi:hypothetical protein
MRSQFDSVTVEFPCILILTYIYNSLYGESILEIKKSVVVPQRMTINIFVFRRKI